MSLATQPALALPAIHLGSLEVSRLILGTNPVNGFSHQSDARSRAMVEWFTIERIFDLLREAERCGITAVIARADQFVMRLFAEYWRAGGRIRWIAQSAPEWADHAYNIRTAIDAGAGAAFVHGGVVDRAFMDGQPEKIFALIASVRAAGVPVGAAAHNPEHLLRLQALGAPCDFYLPCLYNLTGYMGKKAIDPNEFFSHEDRPIALAAAARLQTPCILYKILGAGRLTLEQALIDVAPALRPGDGVLVGMFPPDGDDLVRDNVRRFIAATA